MPGRNLVLPDNCAIAFGPAMTGRSSAAGDAFECAVTDRTRGRVERGEGDHRRDAQGFTPLRKACDHIRPKSPHPIPPEMPESRIALNHDRLALAPMRCL